MMYVYLGCYQGYKDKMKDLSLGFLYPELELGGIRAESRLHYALILPKRTLR